MVYYGRRNLEQSAREINREKVRKIIEDAKLLVDAIGFIFYRS